MTFFIRLMLVAIVLISITNVMIMAVYERIREIGTIAAIGTPPGRILSMFVIEGFCLGIVGAVIGNVVGVVVVSIITMSRITFNFGMQQGLVLQAQRQPPRPRRHIGDGDRRFGDSQSPAGVQGVADGAHRGAETCVALPAWSG